jgi:hypothetical protein
MKYWRIGTSKPKHHRSATEFSLLGPLRQQDFSSTRKLARQNLKMNQRTNDVSQISIIENTSDEEIHSTTQHIQRTPATFDTYVNICKTIAAFKKCCPNHHDVDDNFLTELTGFRLLELRASPYSVKRPGNIYQTKKKVNRLVEIANHKIRRVAFRTKRICVTSQLTDESTSLIPTDSMTSSVQVPTESFRIMTND